MRLLEIMTRNVVVVQPDDNIQTAAKKMREHNIGFLPVCDGEKLIGVLSDRDISSRVVADGKDPKTITTGEAASKPVLYCFEDQEVGEAAKIMRDQQIRRLVVLNRDSKKMVGVLSLGDVATNSTEEISGEALQGISQPEDPAKAM